MLKLIRSPQLGGNQNAENPTKLRMTFVGGTQMPTVIRDKGQNMGVNAKGNSLLWHLPCVAMYPLAYGSDERDTVTL